MMHFHHKNHISRCITMGLVFLSLSMFAQSSVTKKDKQKAAIKTSAICHMCKKKIEERVKTLPGIEKAVLSLGNSTLKVTYHPATVSLETIKQTITALGYDADDLGADPSAYEQLPTCCKKNKSSKKR